MTRVRALPVPAGESARTDADPPRQRSFRSRVFDRYNFVLAVGLFTVVGLSTGPPLGLTFVLTVLLAATHLHIMFAIFGWLHGRGRLVFEDALAEVRG